MSAGGHMMDMAQRMKQNRLLRNARRERTKKVLDSHRDANPYAEVTKKSVKLTESELKIFAERVKVEKTKERASVRKKTLMAMLLLLIATLLLFGITS